MSSHDAYPEPKEFALSPREYIRRLNRGWRPGDPWPPRQEEDPEQALPPDDQEDWWDDDPHTSVDGWGEEGMP